MIERNGARLAVGGVGDMWEGIVDVTRAFRDIPANVPRILLSHNPDLAEELSPGIRVDLQISGHTHGGQVRIPFGPAIQVPSRYGDKYSSGLVQGKSHRVYVNRGIASNHGVRFCCPPEVTGITLRTQRAG